MRLLLEMIESVRRYGYEDMEIPASKDRPSTHYSSKKADHFFNIVEKCQPFVFTLNVHTTELPEMVDENGIFKEAPLDAPFAVFSIEMLNGDITVPRPQDAMKVTFHAVLAYEVSPKKFKYFALWSGNLKHKRVIHTGIFDSLVEQFIQRINSQKCGVEKVKEKIRIGSGSSRKLHTFKRIVHVRPKNEISERSETSGREIEWSHRWFVRGHWRALRTSLKPGKDRAGNYAVSGFTWVSEHEKGPDNLPAIKKTRIQESFLPATK